MPRRFPLHTDLLIPKIINLLFEHDMKFMRYELYENKLLLKHCDVKKTLSKLKKYTLTPTIRKK